MKRITFVLFTLIVASITCKAADSTLLLRQPALSEDHMAFVYAGDIWVANTDGSQPRRLTSHPAVEKDPVFSPDGKWIAFSGIYEENRDTYIIPVAGGQPKRLTWHPYTDMPQYWSADSKRVFFTSARETDHGRSRQLFSVSIDGGAPKKEMAARIFQGQSNKDGELAYIIYMPAYRGLFGYAAGWKGYRGGTAPEIQIMSADQTEVQSIPGEGSINFNPMWIGDKVYFLSDREDKIIKLFEYDTKEGELQRLTDNDLWDIRSASVHDKTIVYESGGAIYSFDPKKRKARAVEVSITPDLPQLRKSWKNAASNQQSLHFSKTGKRALITGRGEVFTVPVKDGSTRNISRTGDTREYSAIWSNDGQKIAWIVENTDRSGQSLVVSDQFGEIEKTLPLGEHFYSLRAWVGEEPTKLLYTDNHLGLHMIDLESGDSTTIVTHTRRAWFHLDVSADGKWIAYTKEQANYHGDLMLYEVETGESHMVSDGIADITAPAFSPDGKYLYFLASTNVGPVQYGLNMSTRERPIRSGLYAAILAADGKSPLLPKTGNEEAEESTDEEAESDETDASEQSESEAEKTSEDAEADAESDAESPEASKEGTEKDAEEATMVVDVEGIQNRVISLPVAERWLGNLDVDKDGNLYYVEYTQRGVANLPAGQSLAASNRLMRFDMEKKEEGKWMDGTASFVMSADHSNLLIVSHNGSISVSPTGAKADSKPLDTSGCRILVDPKLEWRQIFDEAWRMQKEFFYAENMHNLDWDAVYEQYFPLLDHVGSREDLNELVVEMIAELHSGHNNFGGGDIYRGSPVSIGMLGANLGAVDGYYQVTEVYSGAAWTPFLQGPLAIPGNEVNAGEFILAIDNLELTAQDNIFERLSGTVGKQVTLTVATDIEGTDARDVVVEPAHYGTTDQLRMWQWVENNRQYVSEKTDGKVGYIYLPNTAGDGYEFFNRMFFPQIDKEALIIDERANAGGHAADYIIETLARKHLSNWKDRSGMIARTPAGAHHGPKVMLIDQDAGSGGDYLPYMFRYTGAGKLMGTRTWGGLIGISANPSMIDGGAHTVPFFRFIDPYNEWSVENEGVAPDIEVQLDPVQYIQGVDSQLEAAIDHIMGELETFEPVIPSVAPPLPTEVGE
jgi:tricorn protease